MPRSWLCMVLISMMQRYILTVFVKYIEIGRYYNQIWFEERKHQYWAECNTLYYYLWCLYFSYIQGQKETVKGITLEKLTTNMNLYCKTKYQSSVIFNKFHCPVYVMHNWYEIKSKKPMEFQMWSNWQKKSTGPFFYIGERII